MLISVGKFIGYKQENSTYNISTIKKNPVNPKKTFCKIFDSENNFVVRITLKIRRTGVIMYYVNMFLESILYGKLYKLICREHGYFISYVFNFRFV